MNKKKKILSIVLILCMVFCMLPMHTQAATANLLTNPGGETITGSDTLVSHNGWSEESSPPRGYSYPAFTTPFILAPHSGSNMMGFYCPGNPSSIQSNCYQDISVTTQTSYNLSGYLCVKMDNNGKATLRIAALDNGDNLIGTAEERIVTTASAATEGDWTLVTLTGSIPSGTAKLRVTIEGDLKARGFAAFDDLSLTLSEAPSNPPSATPTATVTIVAKTDATQSQVNFTLTNNPAYANSQTWAVYTSQTGTTLATGVTAINNENILSLYADPDIPAATYYVSVTETGKLESARLALTVGAYVPPAPDVAEIGNTGYTTLQAAVDAATSNTTIKLLSNIDLSATLAVTNNNSFTIDLNGKVLNGGSNIAINHSGGGVLTITDSSSNADGMITSTKADLSGVCGTIYQSGGSLVIEKGKVINTRPDNMPGASICCIIGNVTVSGGEVSTTGISSIAIINYSEGDVSISGGKVNVAGRTAIYKEKSGKVNISGGEVSSVSGFGKTIYNNSTGEVNISGGEVSSSGERGVAIYNISIGKVIITGGTISATGQSGKAIVNLSTGIISIPSGTVVINGTEFAMDKVPDLTSYNNVKITASTTNTDGTATATIVKNDIVTNGVNTYKYLKFEPGVNPSISISDSSILEGNSGNKTLIFSITLSSPSTETITVDYETVGNTAKAGEDYTAANGTVTFSFGETTKTISITVLGDSTFEPDETVLLKLSNPGNATIADGQGIGTIQNDDATKPGAPTIGTAQESDGFALVSFTPPASDGGSAITGYTVTSSPGGLSATSTASPIIVTGLTNGTSYTFTVTATNAIGTSSASSPSNAVTPGNRPTVTTTAATGLERTNATLNGTVNANGLSTNVWFEYGTTSGYGKSANATQSAVTGNSSTQVSREITGLDANTIYHYRVVAQNSFGVVPGADQTFTTLDFPKVTAANISFSGATGMGGTYKIGDTVTATWNNTATGDNNSAITSVTMNLSGFGGSTETIATNAGDIWTASYTIKTGSIDSINRTVAVTATNTVGSTTVVSLMLVTVDAIAPKVTDSHISLSGATGTGGTFKLGDTVTASWNNTYLGDYNNDTISNVTVDFSAFGGGTTVAAINSSGIWTATYTIDENSSFGTNKNVSITVIDNAGNTTTTADTTNTTVIRNETISHLDLTGRLIAPALGATPSTAAISDAQYTGTVSWNGNPVKFLGNTVYTATVTLTANTGFTFDSVAKDAFTYTEATGVTNAAGSGNTMTVTIEFSATAERTLQSIAITTPPTKVDYKHGESFSQAGMIVKATYNDGTENMNFTGYSVDKTVLIMGDDIVKLTANGTSISATQSITVSKADGPAVSGVAAVGCTNTHNNDGKLTGVTGAMQYKKDSAASYTDGNVDGSAITGLISGTYLVRVKETNTHNAGADRTFTVGEYVKNALTGTVTISGTPKFGQTLTATYTPGNSTGALSYQWKRSGDNIGTGSNSYKLVEADINKVITCEVQSTEQNGSVTGNTTTIAKADGPAVSGVAAVGCTHSHNDGKLTGVTGTMEYKKEGAATYTKGNDDGSAITGLTSGTYQVRVKATTTHNAGADSTFTVGAYVAPAPNNTNPGNNSADTTAKKEGKIEKDQKQDENAPAANLNDSTEDLKSKLLSKEEQEQVAAGQDAKVILKIEDISASVSAEDKKKIEETLLKQEQTTSDTALLYVDISLYKKIGDNTETKVTETSGKISISIEVPETMWNTNTGVDRNYRVIRIHNGVAEVLEGIYDPVTHLFTFETDRFSTYALTYQDLNIIPVAIDESKANLPLAVQEFYHLRLTAEATNNTQKLSYAKLSDADGYFIYGAKCGQKMKMIAEVEGSTRQYTVKKLKQATFYKYQVKAYKIINGQKVILAVSKIIHSITESKTYANPSEVTTDIAIVNLAAGESKAVNCQLIIPEEKILKAHTASIRYESTNKKIATVDSKGKIKAKATGNCYVYAYAQNGVYKKMKVTVK